MGAGHFVGREGAVRQLSDVLAGRERAGSQLTVQSVEGPGGIGKTRLFEHALAATDLAGRNYLTLRIDGNDPAAGSAARAVARMTDGAEGGAVRSRPPGYYFGNVRRVTGAIDAVRSEAAAEFRKRAPGDEGGRSALLRCLDLAIALGKRLNEVSPATRRYVNAGAIERDARLLEQVVPTLVSLREESAGFLARLGVGGGGAALRNAVRENALRQVADALVSDLSAVLAGYRSRDWYKPTHGRVGGIDRLLLVLDDYEALQGPLGEFLVGHLLPGLRSANFESVVVILGRDQLEATHPAWDQGLRANLAGRVALDPLSRPEMDQLVESLGVRSAEEKERAWRDTQGYPYYVQLWTEEASSGGRGAVMLRRFHDRTTRWMGARERRWLEHAMFLAEVNKRTLRAVLGGEAEAEEALRWFEREGSVRDTAGGAFRVREYLRSRLIDYLKVSDPDRCEELARRGRSAGAAAGGDLGQ